MDLEQGRKLITQYRVLLSVMPKTEGPFDRDPTPREAMSHLNGMLDRMDGFLDDIERLAPELRVQEVGDSWDKFNRWLGFMQGVFWFSGTFTLNQLREHNIPEPKEPEVVHGDFGALIRE